MKNKNKLGAAIAGVILMASVGAPSAMASVVKPSGKSPANSADFRQSAGHRFVVKYRDGASELRNVTTLNRQLNGAVGRAGLSRPSAASATAVARPGVSAKFLRKMASQGWNVVTTSRNLNEREMADFMRELAADPAVESVELDLLFRPARVAPKAAPSDPDYGQQWNFNAEVGGVRAEQGWEKSTGEGVVVAVVDTGIVQNNADLAENVLPGYDMISNALVSRRSTNERVAGGWDLGDYIEKDYCVALGADPHDADDSTWHGSHVAGTVAQVTNNDEYVAGLAYNAKVMPIRVLGSCGGFGSDISDGVIWAAGGSVPGLPVNSNPAEVINMSLGSLRPSTCPASYQAAIDQAVSLGSIVVVAAGNDNANASTYTMGSCNNVIVVGATQINGGRSNYSNWGPRVDIAAPGGGAPWLGDPEGPIWQVVNASTTAPTNEFKLGVGIGTSMASPHVAAAVAMVQSVVDVPLSTAQMRTLLQETARPFPGTVPANRPIGPGILNVAALLEEATAEPCDPTVDDCGPTGTALSNKVALAGQNGVAGGETLYHFEAEAGKVLTFMTYGGSGDVAMYVSFEEEPSASDHDAKSARAGNSETVRITAPKAGVYYVKLVGTKNYSGVSLVARQ
jgi:serine protease